MKNITIYEISGERELEYTIYIYINKLNNMFKLPCSRRHFTICNAHVKKYIWKKNFITTTSKINNNHHQQNIFIHEVTPRDGLQNEKQAILNVDQKIQVVKHLVDTNPSSIEVCSFVREDRVPAMKGSAELVERLSQDDTIIQAKKNGMNFAALVPNLKGFETFLNANNQSNNLLDTAVVLTSSTESHSKANVGMGLSKALDVTCQIIKNAREENLRVYAFASLAFGCPFEGKVDPNVVKDIVDAYSEMDCTRIVLADTQGVGKPGQVGELINLIDENKVPRDKIGMHMHDTHQMAHLNIIEGLKYGIQHFDSATGGCGGCNFAPGALGNISTQKLLNTIEMYDDDDDGKKKYNHGMDHDALYQTQIYLESCLGKDLPFKYGS